MSHHKSKRNPIRHARLTDQIRKDIALIINREFTAARVGIITLSKIVLSCDYAHAKIYFTVLGAIPDAVASFLNRKNGWLHYCLYKSLSMHTIPKLLFVYDAQTTQAIKLSILIDSVNKTTCSTSESCRSLRSNSISSNFPLFDSNNG